MLRTIPLPLTDDPTSAGFWAATRKGRFAVQRCDACAALRFPPRPFCRACQSAAVNWVPVSGHGRIWSFAVVHPPVLPAFAQFVPFPIVIVALEENPAFRISGNVVAGPGAPINSVHPATLRIGQEVKAIFEEAAPDVMLPRWVLAVPASAAKESSA